MREYIGRICPYCHKPLAQGDVVVFCDACGLPQHLACWQAKSGCATPGCTGKIAEMIGNPAMVTPPSVPTYVAPPAPVAPSAPAPSVAGKTLEILSESKERLFYTIPLVLENTALITDRAGGQLFARCTFRSLSALPIKAVMIAITCQDVWGNTLGQPLYHQFLDLRAAQNALFGRSQPIVIPDNQTRSIQVAVQKVLFEDGTVAENVAVASTAPAAVLLKEQLGADVAAQYARETTAKATYIPEEVGAYWSCTCGALLSDGDAPCPACGSTKEQLLAALNVETLAENARIYKEAEQRKANAARAAEEERIRLQEQETRRRILRDEMIRADIEADKKRKKTIGIIVGAVAAVIVAIILIVVVGEPYRRYDEACEYMRTGEYTYAADIFAELGDFQDSREKAAYCIYTLVDETLVEDAYFYWDASYGDYLTPTYREMVLERVLEHINAHPDISYWVSDGENLHPNSVYNVLLLLPDTMDGVADLQYLFYDVIYEFSLYSTDDYIRENMHFLKSMWHIGLVQSYLQSDEQLAIFMEGDWETSSGDYYVNFYENDSGGTSITYTLPWPKVKDDDYYDVVGGIFVFENSNGEEVAKVWRFTFIDPDTVTAYCYSNGRSYTMYRD